MSKIIAGLVIGLSLLASACTTASNRNAEDYPGVQQPSQYRR